MSAAAAPVLELRVALRVPDLDAAVERSQAQGARLVHAPVATPWGDLTVRFEDPDGTQVTSYQAGV